MKITTTDNVSTITCTKEETFKVCEVILDALKTNIPKELHDDKFINAHAELVSGYNKVEQSKEINIDLVSELNKYLPMIVKVLKFTVLYKSVIKSVVTPIMALWNKFNPDNYEACTLNDPVNKESVISKYSELSW